MTHGSIGGRRAASGAVAVSLLWACYVLVFPFHRVWVLPWLGYKLQPPELVLVALVSTAVAIGVRDRMPWRFTPTDAAAAGWVGANLLGLIWSSEPRNYVGIIEALGAASLVGLYAAVRVTATPARLDRFPSWVGYSAACAAGMGIAGSVAAMWGWPNRLATDALTPIPYLGMAARAQAFTAGPQMLASILLMAIPLFVASRMTRGWRRRDVAMGIVLVLGLGATLSKTALCLAPALIVMWASAGRPTPGPRVRWARPRAWMAATVWLITAGAFTLGSHVMLVREAEVPNMVSAELVAGRPLASFRWRHEAWVAMPTTYVFNKQASLVAIAQSWPMGVGPAGQEAFTRGLQLEGRFPASTSLITPHSTYLKPVAELGFAGAVALLLILGTGILTIRRLLAGSTLPRWEAAAYAGIGAAFLIEAISTDLLNCRHYWLLLAVMAARLDAQSHGAGVPGSAYNRAATAAARLG